MANYVIIGGSSGIGKQIVEDLVAEGHSVYSSYFKGTPLGLSGLTEWQYDATTEQIDLTILPEQIDGVVYCPGSITLAPFHRLKEEAFMADYQLQVVGAVRSLQQLLPQLKKSESPAVVLYSTIAVQKGFGFHSMVSSSKGAIEGLTKALAAEWAPKIRVNAVAPSITDTPLASRILGSEEKIKANADRHPLKKIGNTSDISEISRFLLSPKSSWITGQIIHVDGGLSSLG